APPVRSRSSCEPFGGRDLSAPVRLHRGVHRPDAHASDHVVLDLQYLHAIAVDAQADTAVGDVLQTLGDQTVECLGAVLGQVPVQLPVDVPQVDAAVDQE